MLPSRARLVWVHYDLAPRLSHSLTVTNFGSGVHLQMALPSSHPNSSIVLLMLSYLHYSISTHTGVNYTKACPSWDIPHSRWISTSICISAQHYCIRLNQCFKQSIDRGPFMLILNCILYLSISSLSTSLIAQDFLCWDKPAATFLQPNWVV